MNIKLSASLILFASLVLTYSCSSSPEAIVEVNTIDHTVDEKKLPAPIATDSIVEVDIANMPTEDVAKDLNEPILRDKADKKVEADDMIPNNEVVAEESVEEDDQRDDGASIMWDNLLVKYVSADGTVNYKSLKNDGSFALCISTFQKSHPDETWDQKKEECFWINVYNAFTVKLIVDNYPLKSITDIKDPWDKKFIDLKGTMYSLNQIEHEILRPKFQDPRIHFAVNCASYSCPKLLNHAYMPMSLDNMLTQMTKDFLDDPKRNIITKEKGEVSQLFDWYKEDFTKHGDLIVFINMYSRVKMNKDAEIVFMEYNWELNGK
jgi:hypothetical protein